MELTIMTYRKSMSEAIREVQEATIKPYVSISSNGLPKIVRWIERPVEMSRDLSQASLILLKEILMQI